MISNREGREWLLKQLYDKGIKYIVYLGDIFGYVGVEKNRSNKKMVPHYCVMNTIDLMLYQICCRISMSRIFLISASI